MGNLSNEPTSLPGNGNDEGYSGDSEVQRKAEGILVASLARRLGLQLSKKRFSLSSGVWLEIDGVCESPPILCEAWAHQGLPKRGQKNKVMTDALKMLYAAKLINEAPRKILVFGDEEAASPFRGKGWMAQALRAFGIEIQLAHLPKQMREGVRKAQKRQFR